MLIISYQNADSSQRSKIGYLERRASTFLNLKVIVIVIVNFAGKTKSYNRVGLVEKVDGADTGAKFLRWSSNRFVNGKPIFTFKESDGVIPREDVHKKNKTKNKQT